MKLLNPNLQIWMWVSVSNECVSCLVIISSPFMISVTSSLSYGPHCFFTQCELSYGWLDLLFSVPARVERLLSFCCVLLCSAAAGLPLLFDCPIGGTAELLCSSHFPGTPPLGGGICVFLPSAVLLCCRGHAASWFTLPVSFPAPSQTRHFSSLLRLSHFTSATTALRGPPRLRLAGASSQGLFQKPTLPVCLFTCWKAEEVTSYGRKHRVAYNFNILLGWISPQQHRHLLPEHKKHTENIWGER